MPSNIAHGGSISFIGVNGSTDIDYNNNGIIFVSTATEEFSGQITSSRREGEVFIGTGGTVQFDSVVSGNAIAFADQTGGLIIENLADIAATVTIVGLQSGDTIEITGLPSGFIENYNTGTGVLAFTTHIGATIGNLAFGGSPLPAESLVLNSVQGIVGNPPCYVRGTRIRTPGGDIEVEALAIGDWVVVASGEARPIKWIGQRSYGAPFIAHNPDVLPVLIGAGALADQVPARDLYVSPRHAMFIDAFLIPAAALVNGTTIKRVATLNTVTYFHIELMTHDILIAEGACSESYIDHDNRLMFHNAGEYLSLYPHPPSETTGDYAPRAEWGPVVDAVRARLAARATVSGQAPLSARFVTIDRVGVVEAIVPVGVDELHIRSQTGTARGDHRMLGALVLDISLAGASLKLSDPCLVRGFHSVEWQGGKLARWTNGHAVIALPPGARARRIAIEIGALAAANHQMAVGF